MSGTDSGIQRHMKEYAYALYVHCNAHCLNLVDSLKAVPFANEFFCTSSTSILFSFFHKESSYLHETSEAT